ncbi:hypothetical protein HMPREF1138_0738 [Actinomyces sp. ICM58]|nr:hypothetical protein HMPREF1138_0738 [Actinomyces sp. ICM58]
MRKSKRAASSRVSDVAASMSCATVWDSLSPASGGRDARGTPGSDRVDVGR